MSQPLSPNEAVVAAFLVAAQAHLWEGIPDAPLDIEAWVGCIDDDSEWFADLRRKHEERRAASLRAALDEADVSMTARLWLRGDPDPAADV